MKINKSFVTIELSLSLLRLHEESHYQQFIINNQRVLALAMQFAYQLCIALYALLYVVRH